MLRFPFTKMHGLGNDFVVIDQLGTPHSTSIDINQALAKKVCDRHFGIGADQLLWLKKAHDAKNDARMEIFNTDGSVAEMCGNGIRAAALYLQKYTAHPKAAYSIETLGGLKTVEIHGRKVKVNMGFPVLKAGFSDPLGELLDVHGQQLRFHEVDFGNPHAVLFLPSVSNFPVEKVGSDVEGHSRFPERTNVEFVEIKGPHQIQLRVWERGAGLTLACGTGACAAAVASLALGKVQSPVQVQLPGGQLQISWEGGSHPVFMEGVAQEVFQGFFLLEKEP